MSIELKINITVLYKLQYNIVRVNKNDRTLSYELQNNREQYHIS